MKKQKLNHLLEQVRKKGRNGDTILAHINPIEAIMLKKAGGSGTINPKTGLPEFGIFSNPKKWLKSVIGPGVGAVVGNMILPGIGGVIGGAAGGAMGSKVRGRKDAGQSALRGAAMGAALPTVAGLAGTGANALGATNVGHSLTKYGNVNSILDSIGLGSTAGSMAQGAAGNNVLSNAMNMSKGDGISAGDVPNNASYFDKLKDNSSSFLTKPKNLMALGSAGINIYDKMNKEKPLSSAQKGKMAKEEMLAARLTPDEMAEQERYELALEQSRRRNARRKFLPEERIDINPMYNRVSSPQEYAQTGRWLNYYDNPQFTGQPIRF